MERADAGDRLESASGTHSPAGQSIPGSATAIERPTGRHTLMLFSALAPAQPTKSRGRSCWRSLLRLSGSLVAALSDGNRRAASVS